MLYRVFLIFVDKQIKTMFVRFFTMLIAGNESFIMLNLKLFHHYLLYRRINSRSRFSEERGYNIEITETATEKWLLFCLATNNDLKIHHYALYDSNVKHHWIKFSMPNLNRRCCPWLLEWHTNTYTTNNLVGSWFSV